MARIIVASSGASGIILTLKTLKCLAELGHFVDFVISPHALYTASLELGKEYSTVGRILQSLPDFVQKNIIHHPIQDLGTSISSGSYKTSGMLVIPCSMATLAAITYGLADNALRRAADVMLKERRPLVLVPRETPLSEIHLENMLKLTKMGAIIVPPVPAWYVLPKTVDDIENFIVGKALDALNIEHTLYPRWQSHGIQGC
jgi:4-hydroxy-3-polyprenylbenzoate decarboxylase